MNGMIREYVMKTAAEFCSLIADSGNLIAEWVCRNLHLDTDWLGNNITYGIVKNKRLIGGLIFHDIHVGHDVWWTIYTNDKHWCSRRLLRIFLQEAFERLRCRRINLLVNPDNAECLKLVTRMGFKIEGRLRSFRDDGGDCYILGLLPEESKVYKGGKNVKIIGTEQL